VKGIYTGPAHRGNRQEANGEPRRKTAPANIELHRRVPACSSRQTIGFDSSSTSAIEHGQATMGSRPLLLDPFWVLAKFLGLPPRPNSP